MVERQSEAIEVQSNESLEERVSPTEQFEQFIKNVQEFVSETPAIFSSFEEAREAQMQYSRMLLEHASSIEDIRDIDMTISGEGVSVPAVQISRVDNDEVNSISSAFVRINQEVPMRKLEPGEEMPARFRGVNVQLGENPFGFELKTELIVALGDSLTMTMHADPAVPFPLVQLTIDRHALVSLDGSAHISIDAIEAERVERENREIARRYVKSGYVSGAFKKYLNRFETALLKTDSRVYTELRHPRLVRALGRAASEVTDVSPHAIDAVQDSLLYRIGKNRLLGVTYRSTSINDEGETNHTKVDISGKLLHVALEVTGDKVDVPQFVVEGTSRVGNAEPQYGTHYVPFTEVERLSF